MGDAVPEEDFLLLLCPDAVVLEQKVEKRTLWLFESGICAGFEVS